MFWFSTRQSNQVRSALTDLDWAIAEDHNFDLGVADEFQE